MTDINDLRMSIDNIDNALIFLLAERFHITNKVGIYKRDNNLPPVDPSREKQQFERINDLADKAGLDKDFASELLRLIIDRVVTEHKKIQSIN